MSFGTASATRDQHALRTNWSGNLRYSARRVEEPASAEEVESVVRAALAVGEPIHALGTRHSFNTVANTTGVHVSTRRLCGVEIDSIARTVRVGAGVRYGELAVQLEAAGLALHNLASLPHISVAGAVATGTHGSGLGLGNLATAVTALELVDGAGKRRRLTRADDPDSFPGAVVALGALGVVTHLTLRAEPTFAVVQHVYENLPFATLEHDLEAVMGAAYSVSLFTDWTDGGARQVWVKRRVAGAADSPAGQAAAEGETPATFFGATLSDRPLHPLPGQPAAACTEQGSRPGAWYERLPHFRLDFEPSHGEELQTEYFVPFEQGFSALRAVEALGALLAPVLYVSELRAVAADDLWLSGQFGQRSLALHFTWRREPEAVLAVLPRLEAALAPFGARPHWGKVSTVPAEVLWQRFPSLGRFARLQREFDPAGGFRNAFTAALLEGFRR